MATIRVGSGQLYKTIAAAMAVANPGDTFQLDSTLKGETVDIIVNNLTIFGDASSTGIVLRLMAGVTLLTVTGSAPFTLIDANGNALNSTITGNTGNNVLDGGLGVDTLYGGAGDDTYIVDTTTDTITDSAGTDTVKSSVTFSLAAIASVENLTLTGTSAIDGTGNSGNNVITGNSGNNILTGAAGTDTLAGGAGNDTYVVDSTTDIITEAKSAGTDTVQSSVDFSLAALANVENLTLTAGTYATGNALNNVITGSGGDNILNGGLGTDTLVGGAGNDTYIVDTTTDTITDSAGTTDTVQSSVAFSLAAIASVENLTLTGTAALSGTGNSGNNVITGNSGNNILTGGAGTDTLVGGAGNDTYIVDDAGDTITEAAGGGTDTVQSSATFTLAAEVENLTLTGSGSIDGTGNSGNNVITGNSGGNTLDGGAGTDRLAGGAGNDIYVVDSTTDTIIEDKNAGTDGVYSSVTFSLSALANVEYLSLTGTNAIDGTGNAANNAIVGNSGNNVLNGGAGIDMLQGQAGDDTYIVDTTTDNIVEAASAGTDTVQSSVTFSLAAIADVENLTLTGTALKGTGNAGNNVITGNSGANTLDGGVGADTLVGGAGNDTYIVDNAGDVVTELNNGGTDAVQSSVTFSIAAFANVENLTLTGSANIGGTGNSGNNVITGNSSGNTLDGGAGTDTLVGGAGDDVYVVDSTTDTITEAVGGGTNDVVQSSVTFSLAALANVETLVLTGTAAINGTGNAANNAIAGNSANNVLNGGAGIDTLVGYAGDDTYIVDTTTDTIIDSAGTDTVQSSVAFSLAAIADVENLTLTGTANINGTGNAAVNVITGNAGNNLLDGGTGADTLIGGAGNDTYIVDSGGDVVTEQAGGGTDTVQTSISIGTLAGNVENLRLTGTDNISGMGNGLNNVITGNSGDNLLRGADGVDTLIGGAGNDTYNVDTTTDTITELSGGGTDLVQSSIAFSLAALANVENLTLTGGGTINGTGNSLNNVINGNTGDNVLDGGTGIDTLVGGTGNDTYIVDTTTDTITDTGGTADTVKSSITFSLAAIADVENLTLTGTGNISGTGNAAANVITGTSGANTLEGRGGTDTLIGGAGNDIYIVDTANDTITELSGGGTDTILSSVTYSAAALANVENLTLTGSAAISGTGNALNNVITGNSGNNTLDGEAGIDTLIGGDGDDTYLINSTTDTITEAAGAGSDLVQSSVAFSLAALANVEDLTLTGKSAINGTGNALGNVITGNDYANVLNGGAGDDTLIGGDGNDTYIVDSEYDAITEDAGKGTDTVQSSVSFGLSVNVEKLTLTGAGNIDGTGNDLDNVITGNSGNNVLNGDDGIDTLIGGAGNDIYIVDTETDTITELASGGTDTVLSTASHALAANVENLTLLNDPVNLSGTGNAGNNVITGNTGENLLDGGDGIDTLVGGGGGDTYVVDTTTDTITEDEFEGNDYVNSSVSFSLAAIANVEHLRLLGEDDLNGIGNAFQNEIYGNSGANVLNGGAGNDWLSGGAGDDTFIVDSDGDALYENVEGGNDTVLSSATFFLSNPNVENLTLTGSGGIDGVGNALDNVITGTSGANELNGGEGNDTLIGGAGNDTYIVDQAGDVVTELSNGGTDTVESSVSIVSLAANVENLTLTGDAAINGTGNALDNVITGNDSANVLNGGAGNDVFVINGNIALIDEGEIIDAINGGEGTDTLRLGAAEFTLEAGYTLTNISNVESITAVATEFSISLSFHDTVTETGIVLVDLSGDTNAGGNNLVDLSDDTENAAEIAVIGSAGSDTIIGNNVANSISGGAGHDTLTGGAGADTLTGGAGEDTFVLLEELGSEAAVIGVFRDTITDFQVDIDILQFDATALSLLDGFVFDADGFGEGEQGDNFLVVGNGAVADQAYAQMLYDMTTGVLSIDADGTGESEAVFIGTIGAGLSLTANDFLFVIPEA